MNKYLILLSVIIFSSGCASVDTGVDYDRSILFSDYQTAAWEVDMVIVAPDSVPISSLTAKRIMTAVETEMSYRGLDVVDDPNKADILMVVIVGARDKLVYENYSKIYNSGSARCGLECATEDLHPHIYTEGTLSLDWFDSFTGEPILHGWAIKPITNSDRQNPRESIEAVVATMFEGFPLPWIKP